MKKTRLQLDIERFIRNEDLINCTFEMIIELIYMEFEGKELRNKRLQDILELDSIQELIEKRISEYM